MIWGDAKTVSVTIVLVAAVAALTGCGAFADAPSPQTTHTDASGETVVADWANYPAHAGHDGEALIGYPDQTGLEPVVRDLMIHIATTITDASGIALVPAHPESTWFADENWYPQVGNGYGGESLLTTVNCCEIASDAAAAPALWQALVDAASRAAEDSGLGAFVVDDQPERCGSTEEDCWILTANTTDGVQWVWLTIQDAALDPTGDAGREAKKLDWPMATIAIGYGATVVQAGKQDEFDRAMQDFTGLTRPEATTSD